MDYLSGGWDLFGTLITFPKIWQRFLQPQEKKRVRGSPYLLWAYSACSDVGTPGLEVVEANPTLRDRQRSQGRSGETGAGDPGVGPASVLLPKLSRGPG